MTHASDSPRAALRGCAEGGTLLIEGPGAASIVDQVAQEARELGLAVIRARAFWPDRVVPYAVARDVLRPIRAATGLPRPLERVLAALGVGTDSSGATDLPSVCAAASLAVELAAAKPIVIMVEDVQWADDPSIGVLSHLARRAKELGCCFVFSMTAHVGVAAAAATLRAAADHVVMATADPDGPPADALHRRLHDATPTARRVALTLALLDGHGTVGDIAGAASLEPGVALAALQELEHLGILARELRLAEPLAEQLRGEESIDAFVIVMRAARALAERGDDDTAAAMLLGHPPIDEPWAAAAFAAAADRAARAGEYEHASALYGRAAQEPHPNRPDLNLASAEARLASGDVAGAWRALGDARDASDRTRWIETSCRLANAAVHAGCATLAGDALRAAHELAPDDESLLRVAATTHALVALSSLDVPVAPFEANLIRGETRGERHALAIAAFLSAQQGESVDSAATLATRAAGDGRLAREHTADATPVYFAVDVLVDAEQFEQATALLDVLVTDAQQRGDMTVFHRHSAVRAYARMLMGDVRGAESDARLALTVDLLPIDRALGAGALVDSLVLRGELDEAAEVAGRHLPHPGAAATRAILLLAAASLALETRRYDDALAYCEQISAIETRESRHGVPALWRSVASSAERQLGRPGPARALALEEVDLARRSGHRRGLVTGLLSAAACEGRDNRLTLLDEATGLASSAQSPVVRARASLAYGAELRRRNRAVESRRFLHDAASAATACGASALAESALDELRAAGGRPRRVYTSGADALTAMERRVAREAQSGRSNSEIAAVLFISRKTVEMHLSHAYRKLAISSRRELASADLEGNPN